MLVMQPGCVLRKRIYSPRPPLKSRRKSMHRSQSEGHTDNMMDVPQNHPEPAFLEKYPAMVFFNLEKRPGL